MTLRERIEEEIRLIEQDPIMRLPKALVRINAHVALMQRTREGQMQALELVLRLLDKEENKKTQTPERSFEGWGVYDVESSPTMLPDGSYLQATIDRDEQRNDEGYRLYVARVIDRGATESNYIEVIVEEHFDDLISALLRLEDIDIKKYLNKVELCTR